MALMCQTVLAQQLQASRSHLSTEDGLCSNAVSMISQDDLGFIWIATWNGLSRFDGYEFYNYKTGNSSHIKNLHNRILDIVIDQSQNVWMHMYDDRVFVLNRHTDQIINPFEGYSGYEEFRTYSPLLVTSSGEVLVSIAGNNLYMMTLDRRGLKSEKMTAGELSITSMAEGYQSDIWLGTNQGIHRLDRNNLALENKAILPDQHISCLHSNGYNIYAATKAYLKSFSKSMYFELRNYNVGCTTVLPAAIATPLYNLNPRLLKLGVKTGFICTPQRLVRRAIRGMVRKRHVVKPGAMNYYLPVIIKLLPNALEMKIWNSVNKPRKS